MAVTVEVTVVVVPPAVVVVVVVVVAGEAAAAAAGLQVGCGAPVQSPAAPPTKATTRRWRNS